MNEQDTPGSPRTQAPQAARAGRVTFWARQAPGDSVRAAGLTLGFGFGGLADEIAFHQILQWHHLISGRVPATTLEGLQVNTLADGIFAAAMGIITLAGVGLLWRAARHSAIAELPTRLFVGWLLVGWGVFNLADALVDHTLLGLHHVRQVAGFARYDLGFLIADLVVLAIGWLLIERHAGSR